MKKISLICFLCIFAFCISGCVPWFLFAASEKSNETKTIESEIEEVENEHDASYKNCFLDFIECKIENDEYAGECYAVYFDFINDSDENKNMAYTFRVKAFQNGIEVNTVYFGESEHIDNYAKDVQPGKSINVCRLFECSDKESPLEIEIYPYSFFDDSALFKIKITR